MTVSLNELNNLQSEVHVEILPDVVLDVKYRLDGFTDDAMELIDQTLTGPYREKARSCRKLFQKLLTEWSFADKGKAVPITMQTLNKIQWPVLDKILAEILGDRDPNLTRTGSSTASPEAT